MSCCSPTSASTTPRSRLKCARYLLGKQNTDGGWSQYPGGKLDVSISVKAYFALKLTGHEPSSEPMQRARKAICSPAVPTPLTASLGSTSRFLGQIGYEQCPAVPPEMILVPNWFPINIYSMSAWSRTIIIPLSIMWAHKPTTSATAVDGHPRVVPDESRKRGSRRCPGLKGGTGF